MKRLFLLLLLIPFITTVLAQDATKKDVKSVEKILSVDDKGKDKGAKPLNPGAHGRANAEIKKATNPGQGAGKNNSVGGKLTTEVIDGDDKKGKGKEGKKKDKKDSKQDK